MTHGVVWLASRARPRDAEERAMLRAFEDGDCCAVEVDDFFHNGQSQTTAIIRAFREPIEAIEYFFPLVLRYAGTIVLDFDKGFFSMLSATYRDAATGGRIA